MGLFRDFIDNSTGETELNNSLITSIGGVIGSLVGAAMIYFGGAYVSLTADASSPSGGIADTASMKAGIDIVHSGLGGSYEAAESASGEVPAAFSVFTPAFFPITTTGVSGESSGNTIDDSSGGDIIEIFFRRDAMPYSCIEKRAEKVYSQLHKGGEKKEKFPTIIAHSRETYDAFLPLYGNSVKSLKENLEIMEAALRDESSN